MSQPTPSAILDPESLLFSLTNTSPLHLPLREHHLSILPWLLHLDRIVHHQIHEFVEPPNFALNTDAELLEEPDLHGLVLLQELEDEVDGGQQDFAAAAAAWASGHYDFSRREVLGMGACIGEFEFQAAVDVG